MTSEIYRMPHMIVSERWVRVPASNGIVAHMNKMARTACGEDRPTTLCTRRIDLVRCPDCRAAKMEMKR